MTRTPFRRREADETNNPLRKALEEVLRKFKELKRHGKPQRLGTEFHLLTLQICSASQSAT